MCRPQDYQQRGRRKQRTTSVEAALHEHSCNLPTIGLSGEAASWGWECCQVRFHVSGKIFDACYLDSGGLGTDASSSFGLRLISVGRHDARQHRGGLLTGWRPQGAGPELFEREMDNADRAAAPTL